MCMAPTAGTRQCAMTITSIILRTATCNIMRGNRVDEHVIEVSEKNPVRCTPEIHCDHQHGPGCGHEAVPHGDHMDYLVDGRLHHPHGDHCDDHGPLSLS